MQHLSFDITSNWFVTLAILVGAFVFNRLAHLVLRKTLKDRDTARGVLAAASNLIWVFAVIMLLNIWLEELRSLWISLAALGAGLVIVNKELVMNIVGHFVRVTTGGFSTGDVIRIGDVTGKVISFDFMKTKLLAMGSAGVYTGQVVLIPNNMLLTHTIHQVAFAGRYSSESLRVPVAADADINLHVEALECAAMSVVESHLETARAHFRRIEREILAPMPDVKPVVFIEPENEKRVDLVLRVTLPAENRASLIQQVLRHYYVNLKRTDTGSSEPIHSEKH